MKRNYILTLALIVMAFSMASCRSTQSFVVHGIPGTIIADAAEHPIATIDNTGQAQIEISTSNGYTHFLQAKTPQSNTYVPFALDYKDHNRNGVEATLWNPILVLEYTGLPPALCVLVGGSTVTCILTGIAGLCCGVLIASYETKKSLHSKDREDYDYFKTQQLNNDLTP